jgi:hypothetical protein
MAYISLRLYGYRMADSRKERRKALVKAIEARGIDNVIRRLERIKSNARYSDQTRQDIRFSYFYNLSNCTSNLCLNDSCLNDSISTESMENLTIN